MRVNNTFDIIECIPWHIDNTIRNVYTGETFAARKRFIVNTRYAVWNSYTGETFAAKKRAITNTRYAVWNSYTGDFAAIKRAITNTGDSVWNAAMTNGFISYADHCAFLST